LKAYKPETVQERSELLLKLLGLDIGTTSICGILFDSDTGKIFESINMPNNSNIDSQNSWEKTQDPQKIFETVKLVLSQFTANYPRIDGIGVTGQMHGILYVNEEGQHISPLFTWQDKRGYLPFGSRTYSEVLSEMLGNRLFSGYGLVTHFYNIINRIVPQGAVALCTIADYIVMRITDTIQPVIDATNAASLGGFNLDRYNFDESSIRSANIEITMLPKVVPSGTCVGYHKRIPVFTALGDNQASFLGAIKSPDSSILVNVGTGGQISVFSQSCVKPSSELELRPFPGGGYLLVGASMSGGKSYAILEGFFRRVCMLFADKNVPSLFDKMEHTISNTILKNEKLIVKPQFNGTRENPAEYGSIYNLTTENFTPEHLMIGLLEGISNELYGLYDKLPEIQKLKITTLVGAGNGIRKSDSLRHALERRFNMKLQLPTSDETAALGAALTAGVGIGIYQDFTKVGLNVEYSLCH
jgi:sedoheptulokinase